MSRTHVGDQVDPVSRIVRPGWALLGVSVIYLANAAHGTWLGIRDGLSGPPFRWETGLTPLSALLFGLGIAFSAPLILLITLVVLNLHNVRGGRGSRQTAGLVALLGLGFLAGCLPNRSHGNCWVHRPPVRCRWVW
jgi:hypothetical protein